MSKKGKRTGQRDIESQLNFEGDGMADVDNPKDGEGPQHVNDQITQMAATLQEHGEALQALKNVPDILKTLSGALNLNRHEEQFDDDLNESDNEDIFNVLMSNEQEAPTDQECDVNCRNDEGDMLEILNVSQPANDYGDNLSEAVAQSFSRMISNHPSKEKIDKWKNDHKPPENCKLLGVPRVNTEIWPQLQSRCRNKDLSLQQQAGSISQTMVAVSRITDKLFAAGSLIGKELREELLRLSIEAGSILGYAGQEISSKRKLELKPSLNKEFASICSSRNATTEWLFGDNVVDQLKASKNAASVIKPVFLPSSSKNYRYQPYKKANNLNYRKPPFQQKGGFHPMQQQTRFPNSARYPQNPRPQTTYHQRSQ